MKYENSYKNKSNDRSSNESKVRWFAPPSGSFRDEVVKIADDFQMGTIMWTVDTIDWKRPERMYYCRE